jgi:hypothetical protein
MHSSLTPLSISPMVVRRQDKAWPAGAPGREGGEEYAVRFMIIRKADKNTEAGIMPRTELLTAMLKYNEEMARAGVFLDGEGLQPSSRGVRVNMSGGKRTVVDGPFTETKELIAGFTMIQVRSKEEAIEWVKRWPVEDGDVELEIRQVFEAEDFGKAFTPELREQEERLRDQSGSR